MAQIFKVSGYIIDPEDALVPSDIAMGMIGLSSSPIYTQHMTIEQGRDVDDMRPFAYQTHRLLKQGCTVKDLEAYFKEEKD